MIEFETLFKGEWLSVVSPVDHPYEAVHERNCVVVLPIIVKDGREFIGIRHEFCPPYFIKDDKAGYYYTVISGTIEEGEEPRQAVLRELEEEAGIRATGCVLHVKGENMPICKSTDMRGWFYVMEVNEYERVPARGDGTENERISRTIWVAKENLWKVHQVDNKDFLLTSMLNFYIKG